MFCGDLPFAELSCRVWCCYTSNWVVLLFWVGCWLWVVFGIGYTFRCCICVWCLVFEGLFGSLVLLLGLVVGLVYVGRWFLLWLVVCLVYLLLFGFMSLGLLVSYL